jgi:S-formylglutathione hydrolase FrmB
MAFLELSIKSRALEMGVNVNVITPERGEGQSKVLYLLHGLSDDHTAWTRQTSVERYASKYNLTVVMPAVGRTWYTDHEHGRKYYTYVSQELPDIIKHIFNVSTKREDTFVAGLSMGGYGAMKVALANPDKYSKAASFSGALNIGDRFQTWKTPELEYLFGEDGPKGIDDTMHLLETCAKAPIKPLLYQACGTKDRLYPLNIDFKEKALSLGYDLTYTEEPETHNWGYWDRQIKSALEWMFEE